MSFTLEQTEKMVRDAVAAHPNRKNPVEGGSLLACMYTSKNGKSHCIAGQVFADAGLPMPSPSAGAIPDLEESMPELRAAFNADAWEYLFQAQCIFDGGYVHDLEDPRNHVGPRMWKSALKLLENAINAP